MSTNPICNSQDCTLCIQTKKSPAVEDITCQICDSQIPIAINCTTPKCLYLLCSECFTNLNDKKCPQCMAQTFQEHRIKWLSSSLKPCKFDPQHCPGHLSENELSCKFDPELQEKCKLATSVKDIACALDPIQQTQSMLSRIVVSSYFPRYQVQFSPNIYITIERACDCMRCASSLLYNISRFITRSLGFWKCTQCNENGNRGITCSNCDRPPTSPIISHQLIRIMQALSQNSSAIAVDTRIRQSPERTRQIQNIQYNAIINATNLIISTSKEYDNLSIHCNACTFENLGSSTRCLTCNTLLVNPQGNSFEIDDIKAFMPTLEQSLRQFPNIVRRQDGYYSIQPVAQSNQHLSMTASDINMVDISVGENISVVSSSSYNRVWSCESCTYSNSSYSQKCAMCFSER